MAKLVNNGAGVTFTTAANWDTITNTPTLHASTNITIGSSSYYSATFTAPNITNAATGVLVYVGASTITAGTVTAYLQQNSAGWVDVANSGAITASTILQHGWYYFRFSAPFTFTATTAGYYRIKVTGSGISGTLYFGADSGGSNFAFLASDNRNAAPAIATDDIWVCGQNGVTKTVTVTGTGGGCGTGASTGTVFSNYYNTGAQTLDSRLLTNAVNIGQAGVLDWDNTANSTLTVRGNINIYPGGTWQMNGAADATKLLKLIIDCTGCSSATGGYGIGKTRGGYSILQGAPKTSTSLWKTTVASGIGTAANPLITTDAVDWAVGDEILFPASSDRTTSYQESEYRFIITKNSSTSYVLSATAGGAESGITAAYHTYTTYALNLTRNVVITTSNGSGIIGLYYIGHDIALATCDWDWVRWENTGSSSSTGAGSTVTTGKEGITHGMNSDAVHDSRYVVVYTPTFRALNMSGPCIAGYDTTGWIVCKTTSSNNYGAGGVIYFGGKLQNHTDMWCVDLYNGAWYSVSQSCTFTRCFIIGCNKYDGFNRGGFVDYTSVNNYYYNCEGHCNMRAAFTSWGAVMNRFIDCAAGTKGLNRKGATSTDYQVIANGSGTATGFAYFHNCIFDRLLSPDSLPTATFGYGPYMLAGSEVKFNDYNNTLDNNWWFTKYGSARTTTSGARTASSKCLEITPVDSTYGFTYDFLILAKANTSVSCLGFVKKSTVPVGSVVTVSLTLPGSTTPDNTYTMPNDANWNPFIVNANYTGTSDRFAKVQINVKATSGVLLIDDIFNGTNKITGLDASFEAKPAPIMFEQLGDAAAVWAVPVGSMTAGTTGKQVQDLLTVNKFMGLK